MFIYCAEHKKSRRVSTLVPSHHNFEREHTGKFFSFAQPFEMNQRIQMSWRIEEWLSGMKICECEKGERWCTMTCLLEWFFSRKKHWGRRFTEKWNLWEKKCWHEIETLTTNCDFFLRISIAETWVELHKNEFVTRFWLCWKFQICGMKMWSIPEVNLFSCQWKTFQLKFLRWI